VKQSTLVVCSSEDYKSHTVFDNLQSTEWSYAMLYTYLTNNNNNNNFRVSNIRVSNRTLIYNVCPEAALT